MLLIKILIHDHHQSTSEHNALSDMGDGVARQYSLAELLTSGFGKFEFQQQVTVHRALASLQEQEVS
jgi:hypothetical protein